MGFLFSFWFLLVHSRVGFYPVLFFLAIWVLALVGVKHNGFIIIIIIIIIYLFFNFGNFFK